MKRKIKISGSVSGVIATGSYANLRPSFTWEEEFEFGSYHPPEDDKTIQKRRRQLYDMSMMLLKDAENKALVERIERERQDLRFMTNPETGKVSPSVTSIINYDADFFVSADELRQYAASGTITHARVAHYIARGEWLEARKLNDVWVDMLILSKGSLALPADVGNFPKFLEKYPIDGMENGKRLFCNDDVFNGELDFTGIPQFKGAEKVLTVFDVKRTADKVKNGIQLAMYCSLVGAKQGAIIALNNKTEQGYSKPIVYNEEQLEGYYKIGMQKREDFKKRYGI